MENLLLALFCILATLTCTVVLIPFWISAARNRGIVGADMNKHDRRKVSEGGGITVILAIILGISLLIFIKSFILHTDTNLVLILGLFATLLLAGFLGFVDNILGWKVGLNQLHKLALTAPIALPLMVINVGESVIDLPIFGVVELGLLYPLVVVPFAILCSATAFNLVAGYNGLEAGLGAIILASLGTVAYFNEMAWLALICFIAVAALIGFLLFNFCPAKVFPGDSLTYPIGTLIGAVAILGNMEKIGVLMFGWYFMDIFLYLKARNIDKMGDVQAFAVTNPDNSLELPYKKLVDSTHVVLAVLKKFKRRVFERDIVLTMWAIQALMCLLVLRFVWLGGLL